MHNKQSVRTRACSGLNCTALLVLVRLVLLVTTVKGEVLRACILLKVITNVTEQRLKLR
jgi:hypothetical protein